jgi:putative SOS response-associated peptidase YedK
MCSHYESVKNPRQYQQVFGVAPPAGAKADVWPCYPSSLVRRHPHADVGDAAVPAREALLGLFGLVPHWATDGKIGRQTYNARSETVHEKPSFRDAWAKAQHCIVPAEAIYEPDWRSGKAQATRIARADGQPLGIAGLWAAWRAPTGELVHSFTRLTLNADAHPLMRQFHRPTDEKRMVAILPEAHYADWLNAPAQHSRDWLQLYPAELLEATVAQTGAGRVASEVAGGLF